jgi:MoaA/NifB/PqqE/SkfB family radical SAM enzyme
MIQKLSIFNKNEKFFNRLELHVSYACFNRCIFCSESTQLALFNKKNLDKRTVMRVLYWAVSKGISHVSFAGGEPSVHKNIIDFLKTSKQLGLRTYMGSNGGKFFLKKFCFETLPFLDEICFSIHGHNRALHDFHTNNQKSFDKVMKALANVDSAPYPVDLFCNSVLTKFNIDYVDEMTKLFLSYDKVKLILVSNLSPEGAGESRYHELAVRLETLKRKIPLIMALMEKVKCSVRFFGVPLCVLKGHESASNDLWWTPRITIEQWKNKRSVFLKRTFSNGPDRKRIKTNRCRKCQKNNVCGGIFEKYFDLFGDEELTPYLT